MNSVRKIRPTKKEPLTAATLFCFEDEAIHVDLTSVTLEPTAEGMEALMQAAIKTQVGVTVPVSADAPINQMLKLSGLQRWMRATNDPQQFEICP